MAGGIWKGLNLAKNAVGSEKSCCSICKLNQDCSHYIGLDGKTCVRGGYMTCVSCRIKQNNQRYDRLMKNRGYCGFEKIRGEFTIDNKFVTTHKINNNNNAIVEI